jgi:non-specific serine/threonine protein kinase
VSERTDVFSLGVTLFHLLTGRYPYKDPDYLISRSFPVQYAPSGGKELPATHLNPHVPEWIDAFIEKATQLDEVSGTNRVPK